MSSTAFSHRVPGAWGPAYPASGRLTQEFRPCVFSRGSMGDSCVRQLGRLLLREIGEINRERRDLCHHLIAFLKRRHCLVRRCEGDGAGTGAGAGIGTGAGAICCTGTKGDAIRDTIKEDRSGTFTRGRLISPPALEGSSGVLI